MVLRIPHTLFSRTMNERSLPAKMPTLMPLQPMHIRSFQSAASTLVQEGSGSQPSLLLKQQHVTAKQTHGSDLSSNLGHLWQKMRRNNKRYTLYKHSTQSNQEAPSFFTMLNDEQEEGQYQQTSTRKNTPRVQMGSLDASLSPTVVQRQSFSLQAKVPFSQQSTLLVAASQSDTSEQPTRLTRWHHKLKKFPHISDIKKTSSPPEHADDALNNTQSPRPITSEKRPTAQVNQPVSLRQPQRESVSARSAPLLSTISLSQQTKPAITTRKNGFTVLRNSLTKLFNKLKYKGKKTGKYTLSAGNKNTVQPFKPLDLPSVGKSLQSMVYDAIPELKFVQQNTFSPQPLSPVNNLPPSVKIPPTTTPQLRPLDVPNAGKTIKVLIDEIITELNTQQQNTPLSQTRPSVENVTPPEQIPPAKVTQPPFVNPFSPLPTIQQRTPKAERTLSTIPEETVAEQEQEKLTPLQRVAPHIVRHGVADSKLADPLQVVSLTLDTAGKLSITDCASGNLRNILDETITHPRYTYQAHTANTDGSQHLLIDTNGRLYSLQGSKTAFIGLTQSSHLHGWQQKSPSNVEKLLDISGIKPCRHHSNTLIRLNTEEGVATITSTNNSPTQATVHLPNSSIQAYVTGIFSYDRETWQGPEKQLIPKQLREHRGRLYHLDEATMYWQQLNQNEEKSFSQISKQPNGKLFALHDNHALHNLSTGEKSARFEEKIAHYAVDQQGQVMLVLNNETIQNQSIKFLTDLSTKPETQQNFVLKSSLGDANHDFHAIGITFYNDQLFAISKNGRLYSAPAPTAHSNSTILLKNQDRSTLLSNDFGNNFFLEKFLNQGDDQLVVLVRDQYDQCHACRLNTEGQFQPEWNLSESLILDHNEGLLQPYSLPQNSVDLGHRGQLVIDEGVLYTHNITTKRWESSFEKADNIKRGQDGQAYILREGLAHRVRVTLRSDNITGESNRFVIRHMKAQIMLDEPLMGINSQNKARAIAPLDAYRFVALTESSELQFHHNKPDNRAPEKLMWALNKNGIDNWLPNVRPSAAGNMEATGLGNMLVDVALDQELSIYVLDKQGKIYTMPKEHWQSSQREQATAFRWQRMSLPKSLLMPTKLHNGTDGSLMVADNMGHSAILQLAGHDLDILEKQGYHWHEPVNFASDANVTIENTQQIAGNSRWLIQSDNHPAKDLEAKSHHRNVPEAEKRLNTAAKKNQIMGMTMKRDINLLGMQGRNGKQVNSRLRDRLRAHVFNPKISMPRPIKASGYKLQHNWQGREGLRAIYQHQGALHQQMKVLITTLPEELPATPLSTRLDKLEKFSFNTAFLRNLKQFSHQLTDSTRHHTSLLGQQTGAMKANRLGNDSFWAPRAGTLMQALNINSNNDNLITDLSTLYQYYPMRAKNDSYSLIQVLEKQNVVVHHQKNSPPLNRQRDPDDAMGLSKSRLILDALTMDKLYRIVQQMETLADDPEAIAKQSQSLQEQFRILRDETYGEDVIRKVTNQGFVNLKTLEACYDAIKSMTKAFSKPDHGLNITTRTVLNADSQEQMTARLYDTITSLEMGESMSFGRNYDGKLSPTTIPGVTSITVIGASGGFEHNYTLTFTRGNTGITASFSRNGGRVGTVFGVFGLDILSNDGGENNNHMLVPSVKLSSMISSALQKQRQNNISFTISEAEFKPFIQKMVSGNLNPLQLLEQGVSHQVKNGTTLTFNVDAMSTVSVRSGLSIPTLPRLDLLTQLSSNLATVRHENNIAHSEIAETRGRSNDRMRFLNSSSAAVGMAAGIGTVVDSLLHMPVFAINRVQIELSIDNRTQQNMNITFSEAQAPRKQQLENLIEQITDSFNDPQLNALLQELKDADLPPKKVKTVLLAETEALSQQSLYQRQSVISGLRPLTKVEQKKLSPPPSYDSAMRSSILTADQNSVPTTPFKSDKLSTYMMAEHMAVRLKLDNLINHLITMKPANNAQYKTITMAKQLQLQQKAADLHCQSLNSAEYESTYSNLHKIDSNDLMHALHSIIASELPPSNADRINAFMQQKPMLNELIRELRKSTATQATVTLELKDKIRLALQKKWLDQRTQPEDIQHELKNTHNLRIKTITFSETNKKQEGFRSPVIIIGGSSFAHVNMTRNLGKINFSYGIDQETPQSFNLEGKIGYASENAVTALTGSEVLDKRGLSRRLL